MPQLDFEYNLPTGPNQLRLISNATLSFVPFMIRDSISLINFNILMHKESAAAGQGTYTASIGLYSLNGSTLSLANSLSGTTGLGTGQSILYFPVSSTSATQNITPGTWFFGLLFSTSSNSSVSLFGATNHNASGGIPTFIGGRMTVSTGALPSSYATSDLDVIGADATFIPVIILAT